MVCGKGSTQVRVPQQLCQLTAQLSTWYSGHEPTWHQWGCTSPNSHVFALAQLALRRAAHLCEEVAGGVPAPPGCALVSGTSEAIWNAVEDAPEHPFAEPSLVLVYPVWGQCYSAVPALWLQSPMEVSVLCPSRAESSRSHPCCQYQPCMGNRQIAEGCECRGQLHCAEAGIKPSWHWSPSLQRAGKGNGVTMHERGRLQRQKHPTGSENCCRIGLEMS